MNIILPRTSEVRTKNLDESIKLKTLKFKNWMYAPELALLVKGDKDFIEMDSIDYWNARARLDFAIKHNYLNSEITHLSIIPTGYCEGGCSYCYAKEAWDLNQYLTPEILDVSLEKQGVTIKDVTFYGGEPVYNFEGYAALVKHLIKKGVKRITTVTSLFFDDETFDKLMDLYIRYSKYLYFSVTLDPQNEPGKYLRRYKGKDTFEFVRERFIRFHKVAPNSIGIRQNISKLGCKPFEMIKFLEEELKTYIGYSIDIVKYNDSMCMDDMQFNKLKTDAIAAVREYEKNPRPLQKMFAPFRSLLMNKHLLQLMKECNNMSSNITILPDGTFTSCVEDVKLNGAISIKKEDKYEEENAFTKFCEKCDFKYTCGVHCWKQLHDDVERNKNFNHRCHWYSLCAQLSIEYLINHFSEEEIMIAASPVHKILGI